MPEEDNIIF